MKLVPLVQVDFVGALVGELPKHSLGLARGVVGSEGKALVSFSV